LFYWSIEQKIGHGTPVTIPEFYKRSKHTKSTVKLSYGHHLNPSNLGGLIKEAAVDDAGGTVPAVLRMATSGRRWLAASCFLTDVTNDNGPVGTAMVPVVVLEEVVSAATADCSTACDESLT
jgi:hypothetical protein